MCVEARARFFREAVQSFSDIGAEWTDGFVAIVLSARVRAHGPHGPSFAHLASLDKGTIFLMGQKALQDALKETLDKHAAELGKVTKELLDAQKETLDKHAAELGKVTKEAARAKARLEAAHAWLVAFVFAGFAVLAGAINPRT